MDDTAQRSASIHHGRFFSGQRLIGSGLVDSSDQGLLEPVNPVTEVASARHRRAPQVTSSRPSPPRQPRWAGLSVPERAAALQGLADAVERRAGELLDVEVADTGNTITGIAADIAACIERPRQAH
jgi:aldehyde dehydrogenase (NAD+)/betaine-aldehyde dehydrogenase